MTPEPIAAAIIGAVALIFTLAAPTVAVGYVIAALVRGARKEPEVPMPIAPAPEFNVVLRLCWVPTLGRVVGATGRLLAIETAFGRLVFRERSEIVTLPMPPGVMESPVRGMPCN